MALSATANPSTFAPETATRHDWQREELVELLRTPLMDLLFAAQQIHRQHFDPNHVQVYVQRRNERNCKHETLHFVRVFLSLCPEPCYL